MKSRVYWNCLMNETILVQELHLPPSGLSRFEEVVPIPKFIGFETLGFLPSRFSSSAEDIDDSFFQYHFLAQVAHRIILTRIRHSLYFHSDSGNFPQPAVNVELHHQLGQWRQNLPPGLKFPDPTTVSTTTTPQTAATSPNPISPHPLSTTTTTTTTANTNTNTNTRPLSPAVAVSEAMLRGRFLIAKFHIGRPYLYKALRIPSLLTDDELEQVRSGLQNAMDWPIILGIFRDMKSCIPIKFAFCSQCVSPPSISYPMSQYSTQEEKSSR